MWSSRTSRLATLILVGSIFSFLLLAQQRPQTPQTPQGPPPETPQGAPPQTPKAATLPQSPAPTARQSFSGTIVQSGDMLVLQDESAKTSYTLDNAEQAKLFIGRNVRVTGTIDPTTNMLRVERVEALRPYGGSR
jgi:hypothetical protein